MNPIEKFKQERQERIIAQGDNKEIQDSTEKFINSSIASQYVYNFSWMGRPVIQYPQDLMALQEIIWEVKPDLIIETGIAHGGSLIFNASMLELLGGNGDVLGIDIDIREHNRKEIENHPMIKRIKMIQGSSIDENIVKQVYDFAKNKNRIMIILDSNHSHDHVLQELQLYAPLVSLGSYLVVLDSIVEDLPDEFFKDRPWGKGDNPKTSVWEFLKSNNQFEIDKTIEKKILITVAPDGYLKRVG